MAQSNGVEDLFNRLDENEDGRVSHSRSFSLLAESSDGRTLLPSDRVVNACVMWDGCCQLDRGELKKGLRELGVRLTNEEMDDVFKVFDFDGNSTVK